MSAAVLQADRTSVRAKSKPDGIARKPAFRTVLDNPLQLNWPGPSPSVRRLILDALIQFLNTPTTQEGQAGIAEWRISDHARRRGRTHGAGKGKEKAKADSAAKSSADATAASSKPSSTPVRIARPAVLDHLTIGINDCTRALESRIRWGRWELGDPTAAPPLPSTSKAATPALRRGHKRKHSSAAKAAAARAANAPDVEEVPSVMEQEACHPPGLEFLAEPAPSVSDRLPPFLLPSGRILPNHEHLRPTNTPDPSSPIASLALIDLVFVCRPDLNPSSLVAHLPSMAAAANGVRQAIDEKLQAETKQAERTKRNSEGMEVDAVEEVEKNEAKRPETRAVYLVPLDVGAEQALAAVLALRRVACIGISSHAPHASQLLALVQEHIQPLHAPWLVPHLTHPASKHTAAPTTNATKHTLIPTHVKHLRTTAPVNQKEALAAKKAARQEAKAKKARKGTPESKVYVAEED